jgi:hypothetical protein
MPSHIPANGFRFTAVGERQEFDPVECGSAFRTPNFVTRAIARQSGAPVFTYGRWECSSHRVSWSI